MPRSRRSSSRRSALPGIVLFLLGILAGAAGAYLGCRGGEEPPAPREAGASRTTGQDRPAAPELRPEDAGPAPEEGEAVPAEPPVRVEGVRLALVVDDLGRSVADLAALERLGVPVTYAVLPFEEETPQVVAELRRRGAEVLCHLPMEPRNGEDPGPGALRYGMADAELQSSTLAALEAVPGAVGVNNHMGSRLSADEPSMRSILGVLADRGLFFLDSRTSAESVGYRLASALGVPAAERQVFLDRDPRPEAIREQFARFLALARERGAAIAIGHPHPGTLEVLAAEVPRAVALGYEFVPVSYLLDQPDGGGEEAGE